MRPIVLALLTALLLAEASMAQTPGVIETGSPCGAELWNTWLRQPDVTTPPPTSDPPRCWVQGGVLLWIVKNGPHSTPLLLADATPPLDKPVLGTDDISFGTHVGGRFLAGLMLGEGISVEVVGLMLEQHSRFFVATSTDLGDPQLERPILDAVTGQATTIEVSIPFVMSGRMDVHASTRLWGAEANARWGTSAGESVRVEALAGVRYQGLSEGLEIVQTSVGLGLPITTGAFGVVTGIPRFRVVDLFDCDNAFYGPQAGMRGELLAGPCWFAAEGKIALGVSDQRLRIDGSTTYTQGVTGGGLVSPGGLATAGVLTGPSNIGRHSRARFGAIAEGNLEAGIQLCSWLDVSLGYTFLWWGAVVRPGDQIDQRVNLAGVPLSPSYTGTATTPALPAILWRERDFWAQGMNVTVHVVF